MDDKNKPFEKGQNENLNRPAAGDMANPFENHQPVEQDIAQSKEELEKEQQFKEAQRERD